MIRSAQRMQLSHWVIFVAKLKRELELLGFILIKLEREL